MTACDTGKAETIFTKLEHTGNRVFLGEDLDFEDEGTSLA